MFEPTPRTAILGAMPDEIAAVHALLDPGSEVVEHGRRRFELGTLAGEPVVVVHSRCGKVAAAATATEAIVRFGATRIVFTGLAGAIDPTLSIGDVVVATRLIQHDLDPRPLFPRYEVPLMGTGVFETDAQLSDTVAAAADDFAGVFAGEIGDAAEAIGKLGVTEPLVHRGLIVTGDQFVASDAARDELRADLPETLCVEMEGAAVAQVAADYGVPLAVVRTISDAADDHAAAAFPESLGTLAGVYARGIVGRVFGAVSR